MERIDRLIDKFKSKSATHPNISLLWINYLESKKKNLDDSTRARRETY